MKPPITNCHVHIFTGDHVPAFLGKTILPWPFHWIANVRWLLHLFWAWKRLKRWYYKCGFHYVAMERMRWLGRLSRSGIPWVLVNILGYWVSMHAALHGYDLYRKLAKVPAEEARVWWAEWSCALLKGLHVYVPIENARVKALLVLIALVFFRSSRRILGLILRKVLKELPGKEVKELGERYLQILKYNAYGTGNQAQKVPTGQTDVFEALRGQYPPDTRFIVLPMDMEHMEAGPVSKRGGFHAQMEELKQMKDPQRVGSQFLEPFIHVDPRRIVAENKAAKEKDSTGLPFFAWDETLSANGRPIVLRDCAVKRWLDAGFSGFKIYPALGYYPFDEALLPIWAYAAQEGLPIMTHCIRGIIYYRGKKKTEWEEHPVFKYTNSHEKLVPQELLQNNNREFQENFTHPLNYLCLTDDALFVHVLEQAKDQDVQDLFPRKTSGELLRSLRGLKVCLAHFGGEDEWKRYLESETNVFGRQIVTKGTLDLTTVDKANYIAHDRLKKYWDTDWYSIIQSLLKLPGGNFYADVSYILHDPFVRPLLISTMNDPSLRERVLFGTDFYVVRNHNSDKELLVNLRAGMSEDHFDRMARENPLHYCSRSMARR